MKPFNTLKGIIGEQMEIDGGVEKIYNGGANQWEVNRINNEGWENYFIKQNLSSPGIREYVKLLK